MKERIKHVNHVFLATILVSLFSGMLLGGFFRSYLSMMLYSQIILALPTVIYMVVKKVNIREAIRLNKISISNVLWLILFTYLLTPLINIINYFSLLFSTAEINNIVIDIVDNNTLSISILVIALIPSILEEVVYRGIFYNEYRKVNVRKGILISALLFALLHGNFNQFSYAIVMGMIFALIIEATDSILSTMVIHFVTNASSVVSVYFVTKVLPILYEEVNMQAEMGEFMDITGEVAYTKAEILNAIGSMLVPAAIGTVLAVLVFIKVAKNANRLDYIKAIFRKSITSSPLLETQEDSFHELYSSYEDVNVQSTNKVRIITPSLLIGIGLCIFIIIVNML